MLQNKFYTILSQDDTHFVVSLLPSCDVYRGHFPGEPISPGVCSIQMVKELAELLTGKKLLLNDLRQVRFTQLITPVQHPRLDVNITLTQSENSYALHATVGLDDAAFVELKGSATIVS